MSYAPSNTQSSFLPVEFDLPREADAMRDFMNKRERLTSSVVNVKENGTYEKRELISGQQWFNTGVSQQQRQPNYSFRLTFDLVALNGGNIPNGTTTINLPTDPAINNPIVITYTNNLIPLHGFGGATIGTTYYFVNDPQIYVRYTNTSATVQSVVVTNNTGSPITQFYWVFEYLKT